MKRLLTALVSVAGMLPLAAFALGLGEIRVNSKLNQPLVAEIELLYDDSEEPESTEVALASAEDFERVGLDVGALNVPLNFAIEQNSAGRYVIAVTSDEPVADPFVDFLIEVNWPNGRLLREYVVLLDPPISAGTADVASATPPPQTTEPRPTTPAPTPPTRTVTDTGPSTTMPSASPGAVSAGGTYEVRSGDTLWEIARDNRSQDGVTINQMMMALYRLNPDAFYEDNINALKQGAILRMPDGGELAQSVADALVSVRTQNEAWESYRQTASSNVPVVSDSASTADYVDPTPAPTRTPDPRLELVPAEGGSDSSTDRPGDGANRALMSQLRDDLARSREDLLSSNQENDELRSRIADLESLLENYERTITLKDAELADLQNQVELTRDAVDDFTTGVDSAPDLSTEPVTDFSSDTSTFDDPAVSDTADPVTSTADATPVEPEPEQPEPAATTTTTATPQDEGLMDKVMGAVSNPLVLGGAGVLALLGLGGVVVARRRRDSNDMQGESLIDRMTAREPDTSELPVVEPPQPEAQVDLDEPEAEAPLDAPSLDDLQSAAEAHADNPQAHLAYLRALYTAEDRDRFVAGAQAMQAGIGGTSHPAWMEVRAMGANLVPDNDLFRDEEPAAPAFDVVDSSSGSDDDDGDLDFDLDGDGGDDLSLKLDDAADDADELTLDLDGDGDDDLSLDLDAGAGGDDDLSLDFDLDAAGGDDDGDDTEFELQAVSKDAPADGADTAELSLDLDDVAEDSGTLAELESAEADLADLGLEDLELESSEMFGDEDAVGTKLDLAKAYIDMGDPEGARGMLEEVMAEGSETQKGEARGLLDGLS